MKHSSKAFALIELLLALAIVAILMGLAFPAFKRIQTQMKSMQCTSNLRALSAAYFSYAQDNDGYLPYGAPASGGDINQFWHRQLLPYLNLPVSDPSRISLLINLGRRNPYLCPADTQPYGSVLSYGFNGWLCPGGDFTLRAKLASLPSSRLLLVDSAASAIAVSRWQPSPLVQFRHFNKVNAICVDGSLLQLSSDELGNPESNSSLWKP